MIDERHDPHPCDPAAVIASLSHPEDVVGDTRLSANDKRAMLAAWASDDRAVLGEPTLRQIPNGAIVSLASIMEALQALDGRKANAAAALTGADRRHGEILRRWRRRPAWRRRRDDDDPPPAPTGLAAKAARPAWA